MAAKFLLVLCASAFFVKATSSQCLRDPYNTGIIGSAIIADGIGLAANEFGYRSMAANALAFDGLPLTAGSYGPALAYGNVAPASGRAFAVTSSSPIAPVGVSVVSENAIHGILAVTGELPVLAAVALEGALPTAGTGSIVYGCGNGAVGIISEGFEGLAAPAAGFGYGNTLAIELGNGAPLSGGLGYGAPLSGELSYGSSLASGLGYIDLARVGPVVGSKCGCGI